jgi:hypothetical protein
MLGNDPTLQKVVDSNNKAYLVELNENYKAIDSMRSKGQVLESEAKVIKSRMLHLAEEITHEPMSEEKLAKLGVTIPSAWEKAKSFITFVNILWVTAGIFFVVAIGWLIGLHLLAILLSMPLVVLEGLLYACSLGAIYAGRFLPTEFQLMLVLPGCLGFLGTLLFTADRHFSTKQNYRNIEIIFFINTVVWALTTVFYESQIIGFMAVLSLLVSLGFFAGTSSMCIYLGFSEKHYVARTTLAAFILILIDLIPQFTHQTLPQLPFFTPGFQFCGTFVYFLGMLILSSQYYDYPNNKSSRKYWMLQAATVVSGVAALYLGTMLGHSFLLGIGGTFFYIYILEKYYEIPWKSSTGFALSLLGLSGILYAFSVFAMKRPQYFIFMP